MNWKIRYLHLLEGDLREAAAFERQLDEESHAVDAQGRPRTGRPRRLPRRGTTWRGVAAALVALLVVAGGIGFIAQNDSQNDSNAALKATQGVANQPGSGTGTAAPAPAPDDRPVPGPSPQYSLDEDGAAFDGSLNYGVGPGTTSSGDQVGNPDSDGFSRSLIAGAPQGDLSKIVRDGSIGVQVGNGGFTQGVTDVTQIARRNGGMVLSSTSANERSGTFVLRIPAKRFDDAMLALRALGREAGILYQTATGRDVTADFIDLHARLKILKGRRALLVSIQNDTTDVGQILSLGTQIDQVTLQIEQIQGQLNFINDQVAESTIKVDLREKDAPQGSAPSNIDKPSLRSAWDLSIQGFLRVLGAVVVGLGYLVPLSVIALLVWGAVMLARRRRPATS